MKSGEDLDKSDKTVTEDLVSSKIKGKRPGRPSSNISPKQRQERSRQSARECRSRKNLRYQYLEQLVNVKEKSVYKLRRELEMHRKWCEEIDNGVISEDLMKGLSLDQHNSFKLETADQSNIPLPIQRSISLPITSNHQTKNLDLTSAQDITKSTKDSTLYKLLTERISFTQSHSSADTVNEFHSNRTQSLSSEDTSNVCHSFSTQPLSSDDTSSVRHSFSTQPLSSEDTSIVCHQFTTRSDYGLDSYNMLHQHNETRYTGDISNVYTQQQSGSKSGKLSSKCAPTENQQAASLRSFTKFDTKSPEQVATTSNYKLDMHEQPSCISDFDDISFSSKGNNTNIARLNTNQSSDVCNIPKTHYDINILSEASNVDVTSSEMELVDWIFQNQSNLSSDRALIESARQFGDTRMVDILNEDQTDIVDISPAQLDMLFSIDNNIDTSNSLNVTFAQTFQGNIKISDIQAPSTVASPSDIALPSRTLHYKNTLPSMLNFPAFSSTPFHRSTIADFCQTPISIRDTFVSQSHHSSGPFNPAKIPVTECKSNDSSILHDVNPQFNQSRTNEDLKKLRRQNVSLNNQKSVVIASASTNREILSTSDNSIFSRENQGEAINTSLNQSLSEEIRPDSGANLKRSHSTGDTPHPNVQNRFPFLSFLLNPDDEI